MDYLSFLDLVELGLLFDGFGIDIDVPFGRANGGPPPELKAALEGLTEQIEANPHNAQALFRRGAVCQGLGHPAEAYADLSACLRVEPKNARAWLLMSECLAALRMYDQAKMARQQALEIDPHVEG